MQWNEKCTFFNNDMHNYANKVTWPTKSEFEIVGWCVLQVLNVTCSSCKFHFSLSVLKIPQKDASCLMLYSSISNFPNRVAEWRISPHTDAVCHLQMMNQWGKGGWGFLWNICIIGAYKFHSYCTVCSKKYCDILIT